MSADCYLAGLRAFHLRRYAADTRARLYNGMVGVDSCDKAFRRGYEDARRRASESADWGDGEDVHGEQ